MVLTGSVIPAHGAGAGMKTMLDEIVESDWEDWENQLIAPVNERPHLVHALHVLSTQVRLPPPRPLRTPPHSLPRRHHTPPRTRAWSPLTRARPPLTLPQFLLVDLLAPNSVQPGKDFCLKLAEATTRVLGGVPINAFTWPELLRMVLIARSDIPHPYPTRPIATGTRPPYLPRASSYPARDLASTTTTRLHHSTCH